MHADTYVNVSGDAVRTEAPPDGDWVDGDGAPAPRLLELPAWSSSWLRSER